MQNTIVYLIGFGGVGKLTIAKELTKIADFKIADNHLINNPIFSFVDLSDGVPSHAWAQVRKIRDAVFETIEIYSPEKMNFIFTNELFEGSPGDLKIYKRIENIAEKRKSNFVPVRLLINEQEHRKRIESDGRKQAFKVAKADYVDRISDAEVLKIDNAITLDTTNLSAVESAKYILEKIKEKKCQ